MTGHSRHPPQKPNSQSTNTKLITISDGNAALRQGELRVVSAVQIYSKVTFVILKFHITTLSHLSGLVDWARSGAPLSKFAPVMCSAEVTNQLLLLQQLCHHGRISPMKLQSTPSACMTQNAWASSRSYEWLQWSQYSTPGSTMLPDISSKIMLAKWMDAKNRIIGLLVWPRMLSS